MHSQIVRPKMFLKPVLIFLSVFTISTIFLVAEARSELSVNRKFPNDFLFGVATSAYQIEGGWNADGKGPSIWDEYVHTHPEKIIDRSNGDVAANSYEFFEKDIKAVKSLGMDFYSFSISWSRVLPTGEATNVNEKGIDYYNRLINKILEYKLIPMVTMFHNDLPLALQALGGFTNPIMIDYFETYAQLLFSQFGDRVKYWITFNGPTDYCRLGKDNEVLSPGIRSFGISDYLCGHNVLKAHAVAYHLYKILFSRRYNGQVGISIKSKFFYSATNDTEAVDRAMQFSLGWFLHPIFTENGNYPQTMIETIDFNSMLEGRFQSRLPSFSKKWIRKIRGSADFIGLNYYTSRIVETPSKPVGKSPSFDRDVNVVLSINPEWKQSSTSTMQYSVPVGLRDILRFIKKYYNNPKVIIMENGLSDDGEITDNARIKYIREHLEVVLDVVLNDECNLKGYTVWSLIDSFEWELGYTMRSGLFSVNMTSSMKERTPKKSAKFMKMVTETHKIPRLF